MREINKIVVHCADTYPRMDIGVDEIRRWHVQDRKWADIGYHFVIRRNGQVENGRSVDVAGAHVSGHNAASIGVCLVGGRKDDMVKNEENAPLFEPAQFNALKTLLADLKSRFKDAAIIGHCDLDDDKTCPNFDVQAWVKENGL